MIFFHFKRVVLQQQIATLLTSDFYINIYIYVCEMQQQLIVKNTFQTHHICFLVSSSTLSTK